MDPSISEAIERCRTGDIDALEPIYRQYKDLVFRICYRMAGNHAQAADWTQDIFIRIFERIRSYRGEADFSSWLYRVSMNYCLDQFKKGPQSVLPLETLRQRASGESPAEVLERKEKRSAIWEALNSLSPKLRAVLILKTLEGLSYAEISRILGIPEGTVGSRLNEARKELVERLKRPSTSQ